MTPRRLTLGLAFLLTLPIGAAALGADRTEEGKQVRGDGVLFGQVIKVAGRVIMDTDGTRASLVIYRSPKDETTIDVSIKPDGTCLASGDGLPAGGVACNADVSADGREMRVYTVDKSLSVELMITDSRPPGK